MKSTSRAPNGLLIGFSWAYKQPMMEGRMASAKRALKYDHNITPDVNKVTACKVFIDSFWSKISSNCVMFWGIPVLKRS